MVQPVTDPHQVDDQVESLDDIAAKGAATDAPPVVPGTAVAVAAMNETAEIEAALVLLRAAAIPFAPAHVQDPLGMVWSDDQLHKIAEAIVEICHLQGWTTGYFFDRYGPYIKLLAAFGVPAVITIKLLQTPAPKVNQEQPNGQHQPA